MRRREASAIEIEDVLRADWPVVLRLEAQRAVVVPAPLARELRSSLDATVLGLEAMPDALQRGGRGIEADDERVRTARRVAAIAGDGRCSDLERHEYRLRPVLVPAPEQHAAGDEREHAGRDGERVTRVGARSRR